MFLTMYVPKMFSALLLILLLKHAHSTPIVPGVPPNEQTTQLPTTQLDEIEEHYQKDIIVLSYIQNFKNVMTEYVKSQYNDLTANEIAQVEDTIEEFLTNFAKDLRDVILTQHNASLTRNAEQTGDGEKVLDDGLSDTQFDEIKARIRGEFPQITEKSADEIVLRLRRNLLATRQKLDRIINDSKRAKELYSTEN